MNVIGATALRSAANVLSWMLPHRLARFASPGDGCGLRHLQRTSNLGLALKDAEGCGLPAQKDREQSLGDDREIHEERMFSQVRELELNFCRSDLFQVELLGIVASREQRTLVAVPEGRPIGYPRPQSENLSFLVIEQRYVLRNFGARPDDTHFSNQNVNQLRDLVEFVPAEQPARPGDSGSPSGLDGPPTRSASTTIVRNLKIRNGRPFLPIRVPR